MIIIKPQFYPNINWTGYFMAWIKVITIAEAGGLLKRQYDAAFGRSGGHQTMITEPVIVGYQKLF